LLPALAEAGYHPVVYDNLSTGPRSFVTGSAGLGDIWTGPLARAFAQQQYRRGHAFRAAKPGRRIRRRSQEIYLTCRRHADAAGCDARGQLSSRGIFLHRRGPMAMPDSKALPESYPCARSILRRSKWMIERILADYRSAYGLGAILPGYFNASGADMSGGIGEFAR